jgi:hypothetical protein
MEVQGASRSRFRSGGGSSRGEVRPASGNRRAVYSKHAIVLPFAPAIAGVSEVTPHRLAIRRKQQSKTGP